LAAIAAATCLVAAACGGGGSSGALGSGTGANLQLMIASSGPAETEAVQAAAATWGKETGNHVTVIPASDISQQLTQAFAGGSPPDMFYGSPAQFDVLASSGLLAATGGKVRDPTDFYPPLIKAFTLNNTFYCAPKDFSTLALEINTDLWQKAGLKMGDWPTTWAQLQTDAKKLTSGNVVGLVVQDTLDRVGAFMKQAGGSYQNAEGKFTFDSPQNIKGLEFVQTLAKEGVLKFPKQVNVGSGDEALGKGVAAMVVEGNWIVGDLKTNYPKIHYVVVPLPKGPAGAGTLSFTNCWGVAAASKHQAAAVSFVNYLTTTEQQLTFAGAVGVLPSRPSARAAFIEKFPAQRAFIDQADVAMPQVTTQGFAAVQASFDANIINITSLKPAQMLRQLQDFSNALGS